MTASATVNEPLPRAVWWIRVLLFVSAGLFLLFTAAGLVQTGVSVYELSYFLVAVLPGLLQLVLAVLLRRYRRAVFWCILVLHIVMVVLILVLVLGGSEDGRIGQLVIPVVILVLLRHPTSRDYFRAS